MKENFLGSIIVWRFDPFLFVGLRKNASFERLAVKISSCGGEKIAFFAHGLRLSPIF